MSGLALQFINLLAALLLLLAFAMLAQRRILSLIHLYTMQGVVLVAATAAMGYVSHQPHLYVSAGLTLALKVFLIPWLLHRVIDRLNVRWDVETLINIPTTLLFGILLVIFSFNLAQPISELSASIARGTLGIALACVLLSLMMMITRSKAACFSAGSGFRMPSFAELMMVVRMLLNSWAMLDASSPTLLSRWAWRSC